MRLVCLEDLYMATKYDIYDSAFLGILQNEGNVQTFLDAVFSFLRRRTDFYVIMKSPTDKMGFPPGIAKKYVNAAFKKYEVQAGNLESQKQTEKKTGAKTDKAQAAEQAPQVAHVEEVRTSSEDSALVSDCRHVTDSMKQSQSDEACSSGSSVSTSGVPSLQQNSALNTDSSVNSDSTVASSIEPQSSAAATDGASLTSLSASNDEPDAEADDDNPELTLQQKKFQLNPESYNGAVRDNYSWSQSITDVDIHVKVPPHIQRGADVAVDIARKRVRVAYKDADGKLVDVVNGELTWDVHKDESLWSLVPGEHIHINLEKVQERWWEAVLVDEPKISVRKIDPSRPITDLDDESQAKIEELMYNEQQKRLGLPQSHEKKVHDILREAWDAEGSPFRGQPFDPSIVNVSPTGM